MGDNPPWSSHLLHLVDPCWTKVGSWLCRALLRCGAGKESGLRCSGPAVRAGRAGRWFFVGLEGLFFFLFLSLLRAGSLPLMNG